MSSKSSSATTQTPKASPQTTEQQTVQNIPNRRPLKKASKAVEKSASAFRTISEVADELKVQQHVLRFWESKFSQIAPLKRGGGRRYYRPEDVELLKNIYHLLYQEGYTIKGVQKLLHSTRGNLTTRVADARVADAKGSVEKEEPVSSSTVSKKDELQNMLKELKSMRNLIG
jgi:DNA-binding transcriptional MerR regulator